MVHTDHPYADGRIKGTGPTRIILLDVNFTLVANSRETFDLKRGPDVANEIYRGWLINLVKPHYVILMTTRDVGHQEATLANIARLHDGWQPQDAYFKPSWMRFVPAQEWKRLAMIRYVLPKHGRNTRPYLALESNNSSRSMYQLMAVQVHKVPEQPWRGLPQPNGKHAVVDEAGYKSGSYDDPLNRQRRQMKLRL